MCSRDNHQQKKKLDIGAAVRSSRTKSDLETKVLHLISKHCTTKSVALKESQVRLSSFFWGGVGGQGVEVVMCSRDNHQQTKKLDVGSRGVRSSQTESDSETKVKHLISKHCTTKSVAL